MNKQNIRDVILDAIITYIEQHGYAPTIREIAAEVGLKSSSSVHNHLKRLFEDGILESDAEACSPRAIRVRGYRFVKDN